MPDSGVLHRLSLASSESLPERMNNPFDYEAHALCRRAAMEVCDFLAAHPEWSDEISEGKMFGVLVVRTPQGELGYLSGFSGNLAGGAVHEGFVPPICDVAHSDDRYLRGDAAITEINTAIATLQQSKELALAKSRLADYEAYAKADMAEAKIRFAEQKALRDTERTITMDSARLEELIRESQFQKAELVRRKKHHREELAQLQAEYEALTDKIESLKSERKRLSEELQLWMFGQFVLLNAKGDRRNLLEIFEHSARGVPPSGAGECAAPKMLQYAYLNNLQPLAMAEFWQGRSPRGEVRRHGEFYPSCKGKCGPILEFMLQGLDVEHSESPKTDMPTLIYEDKWLAVVSKPAGMLSVEGRVEKWSVEQWASEQFKDAERVMVVHRLDMATSGLLLIAKSLDVYRALQRQFHARTVGKRYMALLDGAVAMECGRIELPLAADYEHRPCQKVCFESGKRALTEYRLVERREGQTLVEFVPLTGRTHQLRIHAAHIEGLNAPIVGDALYGRRGARLCLHASHIDFVHPATNERVGFDCPCSF